jgi:hypothetical protein
MARHSAGWFAKLILVFAGGFLARLLPTAAHADEFSWTAQLGKTGTSFVLALSKVATCQDLGFIRFDMPVIDGKSEIPSYWTWDRPISGTGFPMVRDAVEVSSVRRFKCTHEQTLEATAYVFQDRVFNIAINYPRCNKNSGKCDLSDKPFDQAILAAMQVKHAKNDNSKPDQFYAFSYPEYESDPYLKEKLFSAASCSTDPNTNPLYNTNLSERSLIDASYLNDIWHSATIAELYTKGWFAETINARLAACQDFTVVSLDKIARAAFLAEVRSAIAARRTKAEALHPYTGPLYKVDMEAGKTLQSWTTQTETFSPARARNEVSKLPASIDFTQSFASCAVAASDHLKTIEMFQNSVPLAKAKASGALGPDIIYKMAAEHGVTESRQQALLQLTQCPPKAVRKDPPPLGTVEKNFYTCWELNLRHLFILQGLREGRPHDVLVREIGEGYRQKVEVFAQTIETQSFDAAVSDHSKVLRGCIGNAVTATRD